MIGIEAFLDSRVETQQLRGNREGRQGRELRSSEAQLKNEIAGPPDVIVGAIADGYDCAAQLFHFGEHFGFGLISALAEEKSKAGVRPNDRFGAMAKFKRVVDLAVGTRHLRDLQRRFACDAVKWPLPEEDVIRKRVFLDERFDALGKRVNLAREMTGHLIE